MSNWEGCRECLRHSYQLPLRCLRSRSQVDSTVTSPSTPLPKPAPTSPSLWVHPIAISRASSVSNPVTVTVTELCFSAHLGFGRCEFSSDLRRSSTYEQGWRIPKWLNSGMGRGIPFRVACDFINEMNDFRFAQRKLPFLGTLCVVVVVCLRLLLLIARKEKMLKKGKFVGMDMSYGADCRGHVEIARCVYLFRSIGDLYQR